MYAAISFHRYGTVSIQLDFEKPLRAVRQLWHGSAVHWFNEFSFSFWK
jgi:hypothetical protein